MLQVSIQIDILTIIRLKKVMRVDNRKMYDIIIILNISLLLSSWKCKYIRVICRWHPANPTSKTFIVKVDACLLVYIHRLEAARNRVLHWQDLIDVCANINKGVMLLLPWFIILVQISTPNRII